jgi:photosystem II stability/assembly factor-like uncharacterized protein
VYLLFPFLANAQWMVQNSGTSENLNHASFLDSLQGWVVGNHGTILHSSNGGNDWINQNTIITAELFSVSFCDNLNGWVVGDSGTILKTDNGGNSWQKIQHDTSHLVRNYKVQCLSPSTVFILRDKFAGDYWTDERIWRTLDSGETWDDITPTMGRNGELADMQFLNPSLGWVCGASGVRIFGITFGNYWSWSSNTFNINFHYSLFGISFEDTLHGWIADIGTIFGSSDGGKSWDTIYKFQYNINDFCKRGRVGYKCGDGTSMIEKTTDGGTTWLTQTLPTSQNATHINFISPEIGWTTGWNGSICHTNKGGITEVSNSLELLPTSYQMKQNYPNPFNPTTNISFFLPSRTYISIIIFDVLGSEVASLVNNTLPNGWHTVAWQPDNMGSGIYFYKLKAGSYPITKKMIYVK